HGIRHGDAAPRAACCRGGTKLEQYLESTDRDAVGVIRFTCPEVLVYEISKTSLLDRFHARHPGLRVQFVVSDKFLDLSKGDADIALRSGDTDDDDLVGRKIGDTVLSVYASRKYIEQHGRPDSIETLAQHMLVGIDETITNSRTADAAG
ncbi:MAG: LysR substrate-binding domain-containing protein, partial [Myxococcota bacterium]|nr:LysR substrate-binding domain-containing protein [Myxococcota bacterium]